MEWHVQPALSLELILIAVCVVLQELLYDKQKLLDNGDRYCPDMCCKLPLLCSCLVTRSLKWFTMQFLPICWRPSCLPVVSTVPLAAAGGRLRLRPTSRQRLHTAEHSQPPALASPSLRRRSSCITPEMRRSYNLLQLYSMHFGRLRVHIVMSCWDRGVQSLHCQSHESASTTKSQSVGCICGPIDTCVIAFVELVL